MGESKRVSLPRFHFLNGRIVPVEDMVISAFDLGVTRGYAVFEYMRAVEGRVLFMDRYLERLEHSAQWLGLALPLTRKQLASTIAQLASINNTSPLGIRILLTGGTSEDSYTPSEPTLCILCEHVKPLLSEWWRRGLRLRTVEYLRPYPHIKTTFYAHGLRETTKAQEMGFDDVLYVWGGNVLETPRSNFFAVVDGVLVAPAESVLHGITRQIVLEVAYNFLKVEERQLSLEELKKASEAFITGTTKPVVPVSQIDSFQIGSGEVPGPITRTLHTKLQEFIDKEVKAHTSGR